MTGDVQTRDVCPNRGTGSSGTRGCVDTISRYRNTPGQSADYTASFRYAMDGDRTLYVSDGFRADEYPERRRYVSEDSEAEMETVHCVEMLCTDKRWYRTSGKSQGPLRCRRSKADKDKITQRKPVAAPIAEAGKIVLIQGSWISVCR
ncbi:MAG: hypothetical protein IPK98_11100 [Chloracidobacterium sp.]|nr:hypothetical protein [Chloracidobacterium sp.]